jgi:hypothetical protein
LPTSDQRSGTQLLSNLSLSSRTWMTRVRVPQLHSSWLRGGLRIIAVSQSSLGLLSVIPPDFSPREAESLCIGPCLMAASVNGQASTQLTRIIHTLQEYWLVITTESARRFSYLLTYKFLKGKLYISNGSAAEHNPEKWNVWIKFLAHPHLFYP